MNRNQADILAGGLVATVVFAGLLFYWQQSQQSGGMMRHMETNATDPVWILGGTVLLAAVVGGGYLLVRDGFPTENRPAADRDGATGSAGGQQRTPPSPGDRSDSSEGGSAGGDGTASPGSGEAGQPSGRPLLDMLPDDERKVLGPVIDSPGITQVALRDRASFSKSKVSQTVSDLEKRGLLYREKQGRTYRIYPGEDLETGSSVPPEQRTEE